MTPAPYRQAPVSAEIVARAAAIIGAEGAEEDQIESQLLALAGDQLLARRLREWIPEAFGRMIVRRLGDVQFAKTFSVRTATGKWIHIPEHAEPILPIATRLAHEMFREPTLKIHQRIAVLSAALSAATNLLDSGASLDGAVSAVASNGIPAEAYPDYPQSFWKRLFGR